MPVPGYETHKYQLPVPFGTSSLSLRGTVLPAPASASVPTILNPSSVLTPIIVSGAAGPTLGIYTLPTASSIVALFGGYIQAGDFLKLTITNFTTATISLQSLGLNSTSQGANNTFTIPVATSTGTAPNISVVGSSLDLLILFVNVTPGSEAYSALAQSAVY